MLEPAQGKKEFFFPFYFLFGHMINNLLTELGRSVWENLDLDRWYRPHCVRSVLTTSVKILPYRPPARLIRTNYYTTKAVRGPITNISQSDCFISSSARADIFPVSDRLLSRMIPRGSAHDFCLLNEDDGK